MTRTIILTVLIVLGLAVGGYALWTTSQTADETVAESCGGGMETACASATDAGCGGCPSATPVETVAASDEVETAGCEGCPSREACKDTDGCVADEDCACEGECLCDGNPENCTPEMREACGSKCAGSDEVKATSETPLCGGGRCGLDSAAADAS